MKASQAVAPAFTRFYEIVGWILDRAEKFPKSDRFVFGQRLANHAVDLLEQIVEALYTRDKLELLRRLNRRLEVLRVLLRLCQDRRLITTRQHEHVCGEINQVGRMIGGWIRQQQERT